MKCLHELYAIDVALVGESKACERYQVLPTITSNWVQLIPPLRFTLPADHYRRDPNAPPIPSWDWHEAGGKIRWRVHNATGRTFYFTTFDESPDRLREAGLQVENRPPQAWFNATSNMNRAEYEKLQRLSRGEAPEEPDSGEHVQRTDDETAAAIDRAVLGDDGVLIGELAIMSIGRAIDDGASLDSFEFWSRSNGWTNASSWTGLLSIALSKQSIRRKPKTCFLVDANGDRHEWPEPLKWPLEYSEEYFVSFDPENKKSRLFSIDNGGDSYEIKWFEQGRCFATREGRDAREAAFIAATRAGRNRNK